MTSISEQQVTRQVLVVSGAKFEGICKAIRMILSPRELWVSEVIGYEQEYASISIVCLMPVEYVVNFLLSLTLTRFTDTVESFCPEFSLRVLAHFQPSSHPFYCLKCCQCLG